MDWYRRATVNALCALGCCPDTDEEEGDVMAYFDDYTDACAYALDLTTYVLEPVLVCRGRTAYLVGTQRQADLLFVEPTQVIRSFGTVQEVN